MSGELEALKNDFEDGNKLSLRLGIQFCMDQSIEWPSWISNAVRSAVETSITGDIGNLKNLPTFLFGNKTDRKQREYFMRAAYLQCYEELLNLKRNGLIPHNGTIGMPSNLHELLADFMSSHFPNFEGIPFKTQQKWIDEARRERKDGLSPKFNYPIVSHLQFYVLSRVIPSRPGKPKAQN